MGIDYFWTTFNMGVYVDKMSFYGLRLGSIEGGVGGWGGANKYIISPILRMWR